MTQPGLGSLGSASTKEIDMLIKFKEGDPRAGSIAKMDSSRGEYLVRSGAAELVSERVETPKAEEPASEPAEAPAPAAKTAKAKK